MDKNIYKFIDSSDNEYEIDLNKVTAISGQFNHLCFYFFDTPEPIVTDVVFEEQKEAMDEIARSWNRESLYLNSGTMPENMPMEEYHALLDPNYIQCYANHDQEGNACLYVDGVAFYGPGELDRMRARLDKKSPDEWLVVGNPSSAYFIAACKRDVKIISHYAQDKVMVLMKNSEDFYMSAADGNGAALAKRLARGLDHLMAIEGIKYATYLSAQAFEDRDTRVDICTDPELGEAPCIWQKTDWKVFFSDKNQAAQLHEALSRRADVTLRPRHERWNPFSQPFTP